MNFLLSCQLSYVWLKLIVILAKQVDTSAWQLGACVSNPCLNNGICSNAPDGFICTCINGYLGLQCERRSNECPVNTDIKCTHGRCRLTSDGRPTCHCLQGYGGPYCERDLNSCLYSTCLNNGTCVRTKSGANCACQVGFKGSHCQVIENDVKEFLGLCKLPNKFQHGGKCWQGSNNTVTVEWGYGDNLCNSKQSCFNAGNISGIQYIDVQLKPVQMEPQESLVFLTEGDASLYDFKFVPHILPVETESASAFLNCNKNNSVQLTHADRNGRLLVNSSLLHRGQHYFIADLNAIHRCEFGLRLNVSIKDQDCMDPLSSSTTFCNGNGICYTDYRIAKYQCKCHPHMIGPYCERENPCAKNPCKYGGICELVQSSQDMYEEFVCKCPAERTGMDCSELADKCQSHPCLNGGTCHTVSSRFVCQCPPGFGGDVCQININECKSSPCKNGGACLDGHDSFNCLCPPGFKGALCEVNLNECHSNPCINGICIDGVNKFICQCDAGYSGEFCNIELNECKSSPCLNGKCIDLDNGFKCSCGIGYTGRLCEVKVDLCQHPLFCVSANAHACTDHGDNVTCSCKDGFSGVNCGVDTDECLSNPCLNNGKCIDDNNGFYCRCDPGFFGTYCEGSPTTLPVEVTSKTSTAIVSNHNFVLIVSFNSKNCVGFQNNVHGTQLTDVLVKIIIETCNCSLQQDNFVLGSSKIDCSINGTGIFTIKLVTSGDFTKPFILCRLSKRIHDGDAFHTKGMYLTGLKTDVSFCSKDSLFGLEDSTNHELGMVVGLVIGALILIVTLSITAVKFRNHRLERVSHHNEKRKRVSAYINLTFEGGWVRGFDEDPVLQKVSADDFFDVYDLGGQTTKV